VTLPKIVVVGDPRLGEMLARSGAQWEVQPVMPTVTAMWDAADARQIDLANAAAAFFTDGTGTTPDELELSLATFAAYCPTFVFADQSRWGVLTNRVREVAPSVGTDPNATIHMLPVTDASQAFAMIQQIMGPRVQWVTPSTAPVQAPNQAMPPATTPTAVPQAVAPSAPIQTFAPQTSVAAPSTGMRSHEQANAYADHIVEQAREQIPKPADALPGQITISCMSSKGGSGKCAGKNSIVTNPFTGVPRTIEDLVLDPSNDDMALAFDGRFISAQKIGEKFVSGEKETFTVTLHSGRTISATANHPLLTTDGWRNLEDIQVGETLAVPSRVPFPLEPKWMDAAELDLLAALLAGGGTITANAATELGLGFGHRENHPIEYGLSGVTTVGASEDICECGCGIKEKATTLTATKEHEPTRHRITSDHVLRRFRHEHGLDLTLAKNKKMPEAVYRLPAEQLSRFLSVFWMYDGYVSVKGGGDVGATLASKELAKAFQHLLLRFGILSTFRYEKAGKEFDAWRVSVQASSLPAFAENIPLWGQKRETLDMLLSRQSQSKNSPNFGSPTFTQELYNRIVDLGAGKDLPHNVSPSMVLAHKASKGTGLKHLNLNGLRVWCELAGFEAEQEFGWIYDSEIYWDEVVSVVSDGVNRVYDIEIPSVHNFVADDVIIHNSTTALCLAGTIAKTSAEAGQPKKVVLVDLDTRDGQVGSLIGQFMPTAISIRVLPKWDANSVRMNLVHDKNLGIDALLAPVRPRNADDVGPDFYRTIIGILQTTHDVVILDCSVNYLDPLLGTAFAMSDEILFVTTLATTSVQGMARSLTELFADPSDGGLGIPREKVGIVANQVINNVGMGKDKLLKAALGAPLVGQIPSDQDAVLVATNSNKMGNLLKHPKLGPAYYKLAVTCLPGWDLAPLTNEQAQVAENMGKANGAETPAPQKKGLFRR
jgi:cellulose biosynthesis protein BcsQ